MTIYKNVSTINIVIVLHILSCFGVGQTLQTRTPTDSSRSSTGLPYRPSLDVTAMDRSADPCVDFYQYSCGGWKKANPIPPDRTSWGRYAQLYEDNLLLLRSILEHAAAAKNRDSVDRKI